MRMASGPKGVIVRANADRYNRNLNAFGFAPTQLKVSGKDTNGATAVFAHTELGRGGPPKHIHHNEDEWLYLLEGDVLAEVGADRFRLEPGDSLFVPKGVAHGWAVMNDKPASVLFGFQPAGRVEQMFIEASRFDRPPTEEELTRLAAEFGMSIVGPPVHAPWGDQRAAPKKN